MAQVSKEKVEAVEETVELFKEYGVVAAADLYKVGSRMLQDMRRQLRGQMKVRCIKNTLMKIAMEKAELEGREEFLEATAGPNIFLFTNGNPFKLARMLEQNKVRVFAKAGDSALEDIAVPSGNTGLSPGPIIGKFGALGVRTRIEGGNVWVAQDTVVAKRGEEISGDLADILMRLGIRASEMGLSIKAVYERGTVIPGEGLLIDIGAYAEDLARAYSDAFKVALKAAYVTPETVTTLLSMAAQNARRVALESGFITRETAVDMIARAQAQARSLAARVGQVMAKAH